jgi:hypothetical protein
MIQRFDDSNPINPQTVDCYVNTNAKYPDQRCGSVGSAAGRGA